MILKSIIASIETEWQSETGFFWKIRQGDFNDKEFERALSKVAAIPSPDAEMIPMRLVSILWYIPVFMEWQLDRVRESGGNVSAYAVAKNKLTAHVERILGVP